MALLGALQHFASLGQFGKVGQGHAHQKEQLRWAIRDYMLDSQALRIDLLRCARCDVRSTFDTNREQLDTLLFLNALLFAFALGTMQMSDNFIPGLGCLEAHPNDHEYCVEMKYMWLQTIWVYLIGLDLFFPFWSILLLFSCRYKLEIWLSETLDELQKLRKDIILSDVSETDVAWTAEAEEQFIVEQKRVMENLGSFMRDHQDHNCYDFAPQLSLAKSFLYSSAAVAIVLTTFMMWIFLVGSDIMYRFDSTHFLYLSVLGLGVPCLYVCCSHLIWKDSPRRGLDEGPALRTSSSRPRSGQEPLLQPMEVSAGSRAT